MGIGVCVRGGWARGSCELSGLKVLGNTIVGVQDLPAAWRVGLRLESKCEVRGRPLVYEIIHNKIFYIKVTRLHQPCSKPVVHPKP